MAVLTIKSCIPLARKPTPGLSVGGAAQARHRILMANDAEKILMGDPLVNGAIMFGRSRFNVGVLVNPKERYAFDPSDEKKLSEFRSLIW